MKVGDLVTLSEVAIGLAPLMSIRKDVRAGQVVGMVTKIYDDGKGRYFEGAKYEIFWFDPKLQRRPLRRQAWMPDPVWKRTDLKKYRPPKKK